MRRAKAWLMLWFLAASSAACFSPALSEAETSDSGIRARVERTLAAHRELDLRAVTLDVHHRVVTLSGSVPSWKDKRTIQDLVNAVPGIDQVIINIIVPE